MGKREWKQKFFLGNGKKGMGTKIFFREWEKGNGNKNFFLGNGNREWESEKVVPAGY